MAPRSPQASLNGIDPGRAAVYLLGIVRPSDFCFVLRSAVGNRNAIGEEQSPAVADRNHCAAEVSGLTGASEVNVACKDAFDAVLAEQDDWTRAAARTRLLGG